MCCSINYLNYLCDNNYINNNLTKMCKYNRRQNIDYCF